MLEIQNITAGYENLTVLHNVSLDLPAGEIVALIGPNGAGKSTVIKSVFGIADVTKGKIFYNNKNITSLQTHELIKEGIAYVNQGKIIFGNLSVEENLLMGSLHTEENASLNLEKIYSKFPALASKKDDLAFGLSGGQRQMLALGRALMHDPKVLLLDEPSLGLSPKLQKSVFKMIASLREEGMSILIVEQNAKKAIEMADRTYLLENGKIVLFGGKDIIENKKIKEVYLGG